ncbi:MAG TPA: CYTH domain-containing protein [Elusimicrobiales bacterium]|nr:CYTH domain-containing protein [Elusimicrobiales bacterium]
MKNLLKTPKNPVKKHRAKKIKTEIEFKWQIKNKLQFKLFADITKKLKAKMAKLKKIKNEDFYLDSENFEFKKQNSACRIRKTGKKLALCIKKANKIKNGLAKRSEIVIELPKITAINCALKKVNETNLIPSKLNVIFKIINNRKTSKLIYKKSVSSLCFDDVKIYAGSKIIPMKEIELEFIKGSLSDFKNFTKEITKKTGLKPAKISKVRTAFSALSD